VKVLLNQDIDRVGRMGEVINVASGYARNYLIPRGLAVGVTRGTVKDIEEQKKVLKVKAERQREQLASVGEKIMAKPLVIKARCSASGKLFGSITNRQLADAVKEATGEEVDRHKIHVDEKIRSAGTYTALIKLHHDVEISKEFEVEGEGFVAEEPPAEEPEAVAGEAPAQAETSETVEAVETQPAEEESGQPAEVAGEDLGSEQPQSEQG
jgi:large subunit ribosomal protein L9